MSKSLLTFCRIQYNVTHNFSFGRNPDTQLNSQNWNEFTNNFLLLREIDVVRTHTDFPTKILYVLSSRWKQTEKISIHDFYWDPQTKRRKKNASSIRFTLNSTFSLSLTYHRSSRIACQCNVRHTADCRFGRCVFIFARARSILAYMKLSVFLTIILQIDPFVGHHFASPTFLARWQSPCFGPMMLDGWWAFRMSFRIDFSWMGGQ